MDNITTDNAIKPKRVIKRVGVYILIDAPHELHAQLKRIASDNRINLSTLCRIILEDFANRAGDGATLHLIPQLETKDNATVSEQIN